MAVGNAETKYINTVSERNTSKGFPLDELMSGGMLVSNAVLPVKHNSDTQTALCREMGV